MSSTAETSHGRGGAGNMAADDTEHVDGEVLRPGQAGDGAFSAGRGGAGNIVDADTAPTRRPDRDVAPAVGASSRHQDFHTGRGGVGNEHAGPGGVGDDLSSTDRDGQAGRKNRGLADRLKHKLFGFLKR